MDLPSHAHRHPPRQLCAQYRKGPSAESLGRRVNTNRYVENIFFYFKFIINITLLYRLRFSVFVKQNTNNPSNRPFGHDVSYSLQRSVRNSPYGAWTKGAVETGSFQCGVELDSCAVLHGMFLLLSYKLQGILMSVAWVGMGVSAR